MAKNKKPTTKTIDEKASENREKIQERVVKNEPSKDENEVVPQPKFTEDGVKIEDNVFPPPDEDAEFHGTAAGQRVLRQAQDEQKED